MLIKFDQILKNKSSKMIKCMSNTSRNVIFSESNRKKRDNVAGGGGEEGGGVLGYRGGWGIGGIGVWGRVFGY
jgi:hypothetical protein